MPFSHIVDEEKNIVVLKAKGQISIMDVISEIKKAIAVKRGDGITRRVVDMSDRPFSYSIEEVQLFTENMNAHSKVLGSKKMAILFKEIPDTPEVEKIMKMLEKASLKIGIFTDKMEALQFLNQTS